MVLPKQFYGDVRRSPYPQGPVTAGLPRIALILLKKLCAIVPNVGFPCSDFPVPGGRKVQLLTFRAVKILEIDQVLALQICDDLTGSFNIFWRKHGH
jgi:hypothetical protein